MKIKKLRLSVLMILLLGMAVLVQPGNASIHLPPTQVSGPSDLTYTEGTTGHELSWTYVADEVDDSPAEYNISIDGNVLSAHTEEPWQDNTPITVNVDGLSLGDHTVTITIWDSGYPSQASAASDSVTVTVESSGPPEPTVSVSDQLVVSSFVNIDMVRHNSSNGWIVIHANNSGSPGTVLGHAAVGEGENHNVRVNVDNSGVTDYLFAMLHNDTGVIGEYEFPSEDAPLRWANGSIIMQSFEVTNQVNASISVMDDQTVQPDTGQVIVPSAVSPGLGWIVIHANDSGSPGTVLGHSAVSHGENSDVAVDISGSITTTLFAMLHYDNGTQGTYEFPGADGPVIVDGNVVVLPFTVNIDDSDDSSDPSSPSPDDTDVPFLTIPVVLAFASVAIIKKIRYRRN